MGRADQGPRGARLESARGASARVAKPAAPSREAGSVSARYRLATLGLAALVLFPMLGKSGIWDPYELDNADLARRIAVRLFGSLSLQLPGANNTLPTLTDLRMGELGFTSMALGFKVFGLHDWTGRLPLALWGLAGVVVLHEFLARLISPRAGLYGAIALLTMPLYFMQARTMLGDIVTMAAFTMAFCGLGGALIDGPAGDAPGEDGTSKAQLAWVAVGVTGLVAGYLCRGLLVGVAVPALGVGFTWVAVRGGSLRRSSFDAFGGLVLAIGVLASLFGLRALFLASPDAPITRAVGFALLRKPLVEATFDLVIRQLGHALFPWSAFIPFALGRLFRAPVEAPEDARERETFVRTALLLGAAVAYGAFALLAPKTGALPFTAPALLAGAAALAVVDFERGAPHSRALGFGCLVLGAVLCADILHEPERALSAFVLDKPQFPKSFEPQSHTGMLLLFASFCGLIALTWFESQPRRPSRFADDLTTVYRKTIALVPQVWGGNLLFAGIVVEASLVGLGAMILIGRYVGWASVEKVPFPGYAANGWWAIPIVLAALPGVLTAVRTGFRVAVEVSGLRRGAFTMVAALLAGGAQVFWYFPALAAQLSPKEAFDAYSRFHHGAEPLALLGVRSRASAYYARGETESFTDPSRAFAWLTEHADQRRWLLLKADDLPKINALFRGNEGKNLPVLDGRSSQILLASNQLGDHANENSLSKMILDEPPHPGRSINALFEDQLEAIGWEVTDKGGHLVQSVVPATQYHLRVYYRALRPISGTWKTFVHIDGFQRRFNGDHNVLDGKYPMNLWRPGDVVVDDLEFQLEPNFSAGDYTVYFGFFAGDTRFKVTRGHQQENRVVAGPLTVH